MLKYGQINLSNCGTSKTLLPRNISNNLKNINNIFYNSSNTSAIAIGNTDIVTGTSNATTTTANITNLNVKNINSYDETNKYIIFNSPVTFSSSNTNYTNNDFTTNPVLFTDNILIDNLNCNLNTNNLLIKDNVIKLNSQLVNVTVDGYQYDNIISGFTFPITNGYYSGLLYMPNSKINQVNGQYKWSSQTYNYFSNVNKGFYKLKYLSNSITFSDYKAPLNSSYENLTNDNTTLCNLLVSNLGLGEGEIVVLNNLNLKIKFENGLNEIINVIEISPQMLNLKNNINLQFDQTLTLKDNTTNYLNFNNGNINIYSNIYLTNANSSINFNEQIKINTLTQDYLIIDEQAETIELKSNDNFQLNLNNNNLTTLNNVNIGDQTNIVAKPVIIVKNVSGPFLMTNNVPQYFNLISKKYLASGITNINEKINFNFENVYSQNENTLQFSGKFNIITRNITGTNSQIFNINVWTVSSGIEFSPNPILPINTLGLNLSWSINSISLLNSISSNLIVIECFGSSTDIVQWNIELDGISS